MSQMLCLSSVREEVCTETAVCLCVCVCVCVCVFLCVCLSLCVLRYKIRRKINCVNVCVFLCVCVCVCQKYGSRIQNCHDVFQRKMKMNPWKHISESMNSICLKSSLPLTQHQHFYPQNEIVQMKDSHLLFLALI